MSKDFYYPNPAVSIAIPDPLPTSDAADGPASPGPSAAMSILIGGQFNTVLPTLTNGEQSAIQVDSSGRLLVDIGTPSGLATEATLLAFSDKTAAGFVPEAFDYTSLSYVGAGPGTGQIDQVVYKLGGAGGSTVATLTMAYDGSDRLSSVTKT